jgi:hypothetical protein
MAEVYSLALTRVVKVADRVFSSQFLDRRNKNAFGSDE